MATRCLVSCLILAVFIATFDKEGWAGASSSSGSKTTHASTSSRRRINDCQKLIDEKIRANINLAKKFEAKDDVCEALVHLRLAQRNIDAIDSTCEKPGQQESLLRYAKNIKSDLARLEPKGKDCPEQKESGGAEISKEDGVTVIKKK